MRPVGEIIWAVQEQEPVSVEELKLALLALYYTLQLSCPSDYETAKPFQLEWRAKENFERYFRLMKADPTVWLGPGWTPGSPENSSRRRVSKKLADVFARREPKK